MYEKLENQANDLSFLDVIAQDKIEFAIIDDCVLDSGMSCMTGTMNK